MSKNYNNKQSLYFTDRKAYYAQKSKASTKSDKMTIIDDEQYEKAVGFAGGTWGSSWNLNSWTENIGGLSSGVINRFPNLSSKKSLYHITDSGYVSIREAIWLCQKAWEEFQLFRNIIETMVEFSMSKIKLRSTNKSAKNFCEAWIKVVDIYSFSEQFYREMYRSCNIFPYKIKGKVNPKNIPSLKTLVGSKEIPVKYTILNPAQVALESGIADGSEIYKILSPYEIKRLTDPQTEREKRIYNNLDPEIKKQLASNKEQVYIKLEDVDSIFYQKQDYEFFGVPLFYGVLDDIELKLEMKSADKKVLQTVENMLLLVTLGGMKGKDGQELPPNPKHMTYMRELFQTKKVQRVLVSDHTTKVSYVIPDISTIVGKEKYAQVNDDIREGLQSIFGGGEKFSNSMSKIKVFIERLVKGQNIFQQWLESQLEDVCNTMGFSAAPEVVLEKMDLEDAAQINRIYTRMSELGILTPWELNDAIDTGILPSKEEMLNSQKEYKKHREEKGLFLPQLNYTAENNSSSDNPSDDSSNEQPNNKSIKQQRGRPSGSGTPLSAPRAPRVTGSEIHGISLKKLQDIMQKANELENEVASSIKKIYKIESLEESQVEFSRSIAQKIISNYEMPKWQSMVANVVEKQAFTNNISMTKEIKKICEEFDLNDNFLGTLIYHSKI